MKNLILIFTVLFFSVDAFAQTEWIPYNGEIPENVVAAAEEIGEIPICRCEHIEGEFNGKHPGRFVDGACHYGLNDVEETCEDFEILVKNNDADVYWDHFQGEIPENAVPGGYEHSYPENQEMYVCITGHLSNIYTGKLHYKEGEYQCSIGIEGRERNAPQFGILLEEQRAEETAKYQETEGIETVQIGTQIWMAKNLNTEEAECSSGASMKYTNGGQRGPTVDFYDGTPRYAYYGGDKNKGLGTIYSYGAITDCNICPSGFRIPTKVDWLELIENLGGPDAAGRRLLKGGDSGFNGEMVGRIDAYGSVLGGRIGFWWSSDKLEDNPNKVYTFELQKNGKIKLIGQDYRVGNYVRCIKEDLPIPQKFRVHAYAIGGKRGTMDDHWMGWELDDMNMHGKIITKGDLNRGEAQFMDIERVDVGQGMVVLKVTNAGDGEDRYLVPDENDKFKIVMRKMEDLERKSAVFHLTAPLEKEGINVNYRSFRSVLYPNRYLRHRGYALYLDENEDSHIYRNDASWLLEEIE